MKALELRTSLFKFDPKQLGQVYRVQVGESYLDAWEQLRCLASQTHLILPVMALEEILGVLSGGPVEVNILPRKMDGVSAILLLHPLPIETINLALQRWSMDVLRICNQQHAGLKDNLLATDLTPVPASSLVSPGAISSLAYTVIPWLVGQILVKKPMQSSRALKLYQATDASLLAWDDPIVSGNYTRHASALHTIQLKLVLLRGCSEPYIQIRVTLSQIMPSWVGKKRYAWVKVGDLIVKTKIKTRRLGEGWKTSYENPVEELLKYTEGPCFPEIRKGAISLHGDVRPIYSALPSSPLIGPGAGPLFLDQACFHLLDTLPGSSPLITKLVTDNLRQERTGARKDPGTIVVGVIAAHSKLMLRLLKAKQALREGSPCFSKVPPPRVALNRLEVPDTQRMLAGENDNQVLIEWLLNRVLPAVKEQYIQVAIIETGGVVAALPADRDPKHLIRRVLAEHGVASEFIMHTDTSVQSKRKRKKSSETRDLKALNSIIEAIRLSGYLPAPTPRINTIPPCTTVLSVIAERLPAKGWSRFIPVITRTTLGALDTTVFWFDPNQEQVGRWLDYTQGVTAIHATQSLFTFGMLKKLVAQSLHGATSSIDGKLIVCFDGNLRKFYGGLHDLPGSDLPPVTPGAAIVRIRVDREVAQVTGNQTNSAGTPHFIGMKTGLFRSCESSQVYYFVSPSKQFSAVRSQRNSTRYDIKERDLRDPWQQLSVTEITVIDAGSFASENAVAQQMALLCRNAPYWDGHSRLPCVMHQGARIASDHPIMQMWRTGEDTLAE